MLAQACVIARISDWARSTILRLTVRIAILPLSLPGPVSFVAEDDAGVKMGQNLKRDRSGYRHTLGKT